MSLVFAIVFLLMVTVQIRGWLSESSRRRDFLEADRRLTSAQSALLTGNPADACRLLMPALATARQAEQYLLCCEGLLELAEAKEHMGDLLGAALALDVAVEHIPSWEREKPHLAALIRRKHAGLERRRVLDPAGSRQGPYNGDLRSGQAPEGRRAPTGAATFEQIFAAELAVIKQRRKGDMTQAAVVQVGDCVQSPVSPESATDTTRCPCSYCRGGQTLPSSQQDGVGD